VDNKQGGRPDSRWEIICLDGQMVDTFGQHNGGHRIRYYGFLTCQIRANNIEPIRELLAVPLLPVDAIKAASATASTSAQASTTMR
jgi:hypothetical protein